MDSKEFKPVLLWVDEVEFERHLHLIKFRLIPVLNQIKTEFLKLGLGQLTDQYLDDILFNRMQEIRNRLTGSQQNEIKNGLSRIEKLLLEFSEPGNMEIPLVIGYPSVSESGEIVFTDEAIAELKEFHSTYVVTSKGIELLELHRKAAEAVNQFYQKAKPNIHFNEIEGIFDQEKDGDIVPVYLNYDFFHYARNPKQPITD